MDESNISYRVVRDLASLEAVIDLEMVIWGVNARDAVPSNLLHALIENGGVLIVAETDQQQMVGLCLGFVGWRENKRFLWSHMTGVHPDYQNRGIGFQLKQVQKAWALENGYSSIRWTFDPLQRGNAKFNIQLLGATTNVYHVNYYGEMTDGINAGLPSDRLEVTWLLDERSPDRPDRAALSEACALRANADGLPEIGTLESDQGHTCIEIPASIRHLKQTNLPAAMAWRLAVREVMQAAFAQGMTIIDFVQIENRWVYVLTLPRPWFLYVVECSDLSLYTGVTVDIERRLKQHNAGHGAAYTAARRPVRLLAVWRYVDQSRALRAEIVLKKKTRDQKLALISSRKNFHDGTWRPF